MPWESIKFLWSSQEHVRTGDLVDTICWDFGKNTYQRVLKKLNSYKITRTPLLQTNDWLNGMK